MAITSIKVLVRIDFPNGTTTRLWDGAGPYMDADGEVWLGTYLNDGLDQIESAMNGEASTLLLSVSGVDEYGANLAFEDLEAGSVIDGKVQLLIQPLDQWDQPDGAPEVKFTGRIDNLAFDDAASGEGVVSAITLEVVNRFDLRTMTSGAVLSDVDQRARAKVLNPSASDDRFAERIPGLADKTIRWPVFS